MFVSEDERGKRVTLLSHAQAARLRAGGGQYRCPACHGAVLIKNGSQMPAHFAHRHNACVASEPESAEHLRGKLLLAEIGRAAGWEAEFEVYVPAIKQRIDVLLRRGPARLALEFQCSPLAAPKLRARTQGYRQEDIPVRWILGHRYDRLAAATKFARLAPDGRLMTEHLDVQHGKLFLRTDLRTSFCQQQELWPHPGGTHLVGKPPVLVQSAREVQLALHYRDRKIMALQNACYARRLNLLGCPWVVHQDCACFPGLALPEWALRVMWLLQFSGRNISQADNTRFWAQYCRTASMPLVNWARYLEQLAPVFCRVLVNAQLLTPTPTGWRWVRAPQWFSGIDAKLAQLP